MAWQVVERNRPNATTHGLCGASAACVRIVMHSFSAAFTCAVASLTRSAMAKAIGAMEGGTFGNCGHAPSAPTKHPLVALAGNDVASPVAPAQPFCGAVPVTAAMARRPIASSEFSGRSFSPASVNGPKMPR